MAALLYIDLLGVRACWQRGGRPAAEKAFIDFRNLVAGGLKGRTNTEVQLGTIETDSAVIICSDVRIALEIGRVIYRMAFNQTNTNPMKHYWLRGVIVPRTGDTPLRTSGHFKAPLDQVEIMHYETELFDAIAIEKSGIKGMRLLVDKSLLTQSVINESRIKIEHLSFIPFKSLRSSKYPDNIRQTHLDFLWMQDEDADVRAQIERTMANRLRIAATDTDEFAQAAATQVVFYECAAMFGSLETRIKFQKEGKHRKPKH